jgi:hypothetical protein
MKKLVLGAAVIVLAAAACGGGGKPTIVDSGVDATMLCNPVGQTGCKTGEKCTWVVDIDATMTTEEIGHIGCVAVGATPIADGLACTDAVAATNGGADSCVAGDLCISRKCKPICDPQLVSGSAAGACATNYACSIYSGVFESGGSNATAGVCEPTCDPLTQKLNVGTTGTDACGSVDPTKPSGTCVVSGGFRSFHCAPTGPSLYTKVDLEAPLTDSRGNYFGNGCAPGFIPFFFEGSGSMKTICSGMCAPLKADATIVGTTGHEKDNQGDTTVAGKLPTEAAATAGHAVCAPQIKGVSADKIPTGLTHGEDCRFAWFFLAMNGDPTMAANTPFNDTLGLCFAYWKFVDVMIPGQTQMAPEKSCAEMPVTAPADDPFGTAKDQGCYPLSQSRRAERKEGIVRNTASNFRLGYGSAPAVRHIFD